MNATAEPPTKHQSVLADLPLWDAARPRDLRSEQIEALFMQNRSMPGIVLMHGARLLGVLSRNAFFAFASRPFVRELYFKKPVSEMKEVIAREPLQIADATKIYSAVDQALGRPNGQAYEPLLVGCADGALKLLEIDVLLRAQSLELELALSEKDALIVEVQRGAEELRNALSQLRDMQHRLVQSEKMAALGQLVAGVAHEINTPIGVALTASTHLGERSNEVDQQLKTAALKRSDLERYVSLARESGELIRFNLNRAAQLIQSFKQVAIDQTGEQRREFDLNDFLTQLVASLAPEMRKSGKKISIDCPDSVRMESFPGALGQVLSNLITNALIHAWEPNEPGNILVAARAQADTVELSVRDDGKGMPPDVKARIYDPFFTTKRGAGGSGLGLHIVHNIVTERLSGHIDCSSEVGAGTCFTFTVPRAAQ